MATQKSRSATAVPATFDPMAAFVALVRGGTAPTGGSMAGNPATGTDTDNMALGRLLGFKGVRVITGTTGTIQGDDVGKLLICTNAAAKTLDVEDETAASAASRAWGDYVEIGLLNMGAGDLTVDDTDLGTDTPAGQVDSVNGSLVIPQFSVGRLIRTATDNEFVITGIQSSALTDLLGDTTPQLAGNLDANGNNIDFDDATGIRDDSGNEQIRFQKTASAVNQIDVTNAATGNDPSIAATGDDADVGLNLQTKGSGTLDYNGSEIAKVSDLTGKHSAFIPAGVMVPATTSGPATAQVEESTNDQNYDVLDFDAAADEYAHFVIAMPKGWNEGTVTFQGFWMTAGAVTTGVAIGLQAVAVSDNEVLDAAWGTAVVVADDAQGAANELLVSAESGAVTIAGTPAEGDLVCFRIFRDVSDANDDMTQDLRLIGVKLIFTRNALTDD